MAELTVLYDEGCGICSRLGLLLARSSQIGVEPIGSPVGSILLRDLLPAERYATVHVVDPVGRRRSGSAALAPLARTLPGGPVLAAACDAFPGVTERAYGLIARNRRLGSRFLRAYDLRTASAPQGAHGLRDTRSRK